MTALPLMTTPTTHPTLNRMWRDAPGFTGLAIVMALAVVPFAAAWALEDRMLQGAIVWVKPIKFFVSIAVFAATLAYLARFMPEPMRQGRRWRAFVTLVCIAAAYEVIWVSGSATFGVGSHFNVESALMGALYSAAGVFAVILTSPSLVMGIAIWRNPGTGLDPALRLSVALGLVLTFVLTLVAAGTLSSGTGHYVGTPVTGAVVPFFGWSREVGDLRVAHFWATHALQILPLAGLMALRFAPAMAVPLVWGAGAGYAVLVVALMVQALMGLPVF